MRDLNSNLKVVTAVLPTLSTDGVGALASASLDLAGYDSAMLILSMGAKHASDTINSTNKWTLLLEHADDDGTGVAGTYANVGTDDVIGVTPASGVLKVIDTSGEMSSQFQYGYVGGRRFIRATLTPAGTITNGSPVAITLVKGHPNLAPTS